MPCRRAASPLLAGLAALALAAAAQAPRPKPAVRLGYTAIAAPHFLSASRAAFLHPADMVIGVADEHAAKAYPAAILAQHGIVEDQMPDGPIAITW